MEMSSSEAFLAASVAALAAPWRFDGLWHLHGECTAASSAASVDRRSGREAVAGGGHDLHDPEGRRAAAPSCRFPSFRPTFPSATCSRISSSASVQAQQAPQPRTVNSLGSGFVIDPAGVIVTNNHVIEQAEEITSISPTARNLKAELVGRDAKTDIAVLQGEADKPLARGAVRQFRRAAGGRLGARHRQSVRPRRLGVARHRLGAQPRHQCRPL